MSGNGRKGFLQKIFRGWGITVRDLGGWSLRIPMVLAGALISSHFFLSSFALAGPEIAGLPMGKY